MKKQRQIAAGLAVLLLALTLAACGKQKEEPVVSPAEPSAASAESVVESIEEAEETEAVSVEETASEEAPEEVATEETVSGNSLTIAKTPLGPGRRVYAPDATPEELNTPDVPAKDPSVLPARGINDNTSIAFRETLAVAPTLLGYQKIFPKSRQAIEAQMQELLSYWESYQLAAVEELIRLPRYRYVSQQLNESTNYYYVGDALSDGTPEGKGLAVYGNNCYYYGSWKNGMREGDGTWIQIFPKNGAYSMQNDGILYHSYSGSWKNDLPNGTGQEHLSFDERYMSGRLTTNVMGDFVNGLYDGTLYIITFGPGHGTQEWTAEAEKGVFLQATPSYPKYEDGELPVAKNIENEEDYIWLVGSNNRNQGITGLAY